MKKDEIDDEIYDLERLVHKLKRGKKEMVERGAPHSTMKKIQKAIRRAKEQIEELEELEK
jgi:hypothetical protein